MFKNRQQKFKRIWVLVIWVLAIAGTLLLWGFANKAMDKQPCTDIKININHTSEHEFIQYDDVLNMLNEKNKKITGKPMETISTAPLEQMFNTNPYIKNTEVFKTINGTLSINIDTKRPIARIINVLGESFYIDENGFLMPWSSNYTARLPVFTGQIFERYDVCYGIDYSRTDINDSLLIKNNMYGIYRLAKYLNTSEFWKAQVEQVYVAKNVELVPLAGNHIVVLGDFQDIDEKMNKLFVFYKQGLNYVGWNKYETINLKYKNQIVCTKATTIQ